MAETEGFRNDWATKDFYQVLGVQKDASAADIKSLPQAGPGEPPRLQPR